MLKAHTACLMDGFRLSLAILLSSSFAIAQFSETEDAAPLKPAGNAAAKTEPKASSSRKGTSSKAAPTKGKLKSEDADAATEDVVTTPGIELFAPRKMEMKFGMKFNSNDNFCSDLYATIPFPMNWPEQKVTVLNSNIPAGAVLDRRDLPVGSKQNALARQLLMKIPNLGPDSQLDLVVTVEVEKSFINAPADPTVFVIPKKISNDLRFFVGKGSPYIDHELGEVRKVAKQIADDKPENAWTQVERIYDWVRDNIQYRKGKIRHIKEALKDRKGDCEEMTGLFVAICRASNIPARCVWIPEHCYPEFYLEDPQGVGHWFPCQVAGDRQFGQMHDYRPILQKGDRFKVPEDNAPQRYIAEYFTCKQRAARAGVNPSVDRIMDLGPLKAELEALEQQSVPPPQNQPEK